MKCTQNYFFYMLGGILAATYWVVGILFIDIASIFNGLVGYLVSRLKRMRLVMEVRDLWPESVLVVGAIKNRYLIQMLEYLEDVGLIQVSHPFQDLREHGDEDAIDYGCQGESLELVQSAGAGLAMQPENSEDLLRCIEQLAENPEMCVELGVNGREYVEKYYNRAVLARRYSKMMSTL